MNDEYIKMMEMLGAMLEEYEKLSVERLHIKQKFFNSREFKDKIKDKNNKGWFSWLF